MLISISFGSILGLVSHRVSILCKTGRSHLVVECLFLLLDELIWDLKFCGRVEGVIWRSIHLWGNHHQCWSDWWIWSRRELVGLWSTIDQGVYFECCPPLFSVFFLLVSGTIVHGFGHKPWGKYGTRIIIKHTCDHSYKLGRLILVYRCVLFLILFDIGLFYIFLLSYCWTGSSLVHYWLSFLFYTVEKKLDELSFWHFLFPLSLSLFFGTFISLFSH